jgi:hypothetical protein
MSSSAASDISDVFRLSLMIAKIAERGAQENMPMSFM